LKYRYKVLGFLCALAAITYLDRVAISVAGPRIQEGLHISPEMWGWVVGVFTVSYALFEIPTGRMGDRTGARRVLTRVVLWWSAFTSFTGLTSNYYVLLLTRFLFGAGEAGYLPNVGISISRWFPSTERARAFGMVWMSAQIGGAVSPLLIVPIQLRWGWRVSFYVLGFIGVCWCIAWYRWYRDSPRENPKVTRAEIEQIGVPAVQGDHSLPWGTVLRNPNLLALLLLAFCYVFALYLFISWMHTFLVKGRGFSETQLLLSAGPGILGAIGNVSGGFVSDGLTTRLGLKWGRRTIGLVGLGCATVFMVATIFSASKFATLLFLGLVYFGITFQQTAACALAIDIGGKHVGGILGATNTAASIGGFVFSASFGYFVKWFGSYDLALIPTAALLGAGVLLWLRVDATEQLIPEASRALPTVPEPALS
jgi:MFS transporter, ACS family, glucarate transporter